MLQRVLVVLSIAALSFCSACIESTASKQATETEQGTPSGGKFDTTFEDGNGPSWTEVEARCTPPTEDEPIVYANDFSWGYTLEEMAAKNDEIYESGKRLTDRAWYDTDTGEFILPFTESWGGDLTLSRRLIANVRLHIERALELEYASHVIFPDMGHSHFFIPQAHYDAIYAGFPVADNSRMYELLLDDPQLLVLYHTAEQLQMLDEDDVMLNDRVIQWRFFTRNIVGDNNYEGRLDVLHDHGEKVNTTRDLAGHRYHGAGFNISASKDGCFPYVVDDQVYWFDLSMEDLPYQSTGGGDDWY